MEKNLTERESIKLVLQELELETTSIILITTFVGDVRTHLIKLCTLSKDPESHYVIKVFS